MSVVKYISIDIEKIMKKVYVILFVLIVNLCSSYAADKTYLVAMPKNFPPYYLIDKEGNPSGYAVETFLDIARRAGLVVKFVPYYGWDAAMNAVKSGAADLLANSGISEGRKKIVDYTIPIETFKISVFATKSRKDIKSATDLKGKRVAVLKSNLAGILIRKQFNDVKLVIVSHQLELLFQLFSGRVDAIAFPEPVVYAMTRSVKKDYLIKVVHVLKEIKRGVAVQKGHPELVSKLNKVIEEYLKSGENEIIHKKWFGVPTTYWTVERVFYLMSFVLAVVIILMLMWRYAVLKKSKTVLDERDKRIKMITETIGEIFFICTPDLSKIMYVSQAYEKIFGRTCESLLKDTFSFTEVIHPEDRERLYGYVKSHIGKEWNVDYRIVRDDESVRYIKVKGFPVEDENGYIKYMAGVVSDVTDLVESEKMRDEQSKILAHQSKVAALGEMIGAIAHQWRQPLNSLGLNIQDIEDMYDHDELSKQTLTDRVGSSLDLIQHMSQTIDDFRGFFKNEQKYSTFEASKTVVDVIRMIEPQLTSRGIRYAVSCSCNKDSFDCVNNINLDHGHCEHQPYGSVSEFKQVVMNILQNSIEVLSDVESGERCINIEMEGLRDKYVIYMCDNGGGIDEEVGERIFDAYMTTKKQDGTGLGLYMSKMIIEEHMGGSLTFKNTDQGVCFKIVIPVKHEEK